MEYFILHGPGDIRGTSMNPAVAGSIPLSDELMALTVDCYALGENGRRLYDRVVFSRPKGADKALALDTPIPTPEGWTTMGDLRVGDRVFDENGAPVNVVAVSRAFEGNPCYDVRFSDGEVITADAGHLWQVEELRREYRTSIRTTAELFATQSTRGDGACNYRLQMPKPLRLPSVTLPVPPYSMGAWLGDGSSRGGIITVADEQVIEEIRRDGFQVEARPNTGRYSWQIFGLRAGLGEAGVLKNKHIPAAYLRASEEQRWALLQGLMDTDGHVTPHGASVFVNTKKAIVDGVSELLASLGLKHSVRESRAKIGDRDCGPSWKVAFVARADRPPVRLQRKRDRLKESGWHGRGHLSDTRRIVAVTPVPSVPTRCISVDSASRLFMAGRRMVQTHNSGHGARLVMFEAMGPCRFAGWATGGEWFEQMGFRYRYSKGEAMGRPVNSPFVRVMATEENQTGNVYDNVHYNLLEGPLSEAFTRRDDVGLTRVYLPDGGEIVPSTAGAASKDGGRESFTESDETHLYILPEHKSMHATVTRNLAKRLIAEPWGFESSTMYAPGQGSIAEASHNLARAIIEGKVKNPRLLFDHRQAAEGIDLEDYDAVKAGVLEAYGDARSYMDIERLVTLIQDPTSDPGESRRYFFNQATSLAGQAFDIAKWRQFGTEKTPARNRLIVLGFDGSLNNDSTALVATDVETGVQWAAGLWEKPAVDGDDWEVDKAAVDGVVSEMFGEYQVWRMLCDPSKWESQLAEWAGRYGEKVVVAYPTTLTRRMASTLKAYAGAIRSGECRNNGDARFARHIGNAVKTPLTYRDDDGMPLWLIQKDYLHSPNKIDLAMAGAMSWQARLDAVAAGATAAEGSVYDERGMVTV